MLFGELSFVGLAGGVVALADATQIWHGIGSQHPITAHSLEITNHELLASTETLLTIIPVTAPQFNQTKSHLHGAVIGRLNCQYDNALDRKQSANWY